MQSSLSLARFWVAALVAAVVLLAGYPLAFLVTHGLQPLAWPPSLTTPVDWILAIGSFDLGTPLNAYAEMALFQSPAFGQGGVIEASVLGALMALTLAFPFLSRTALSERHASGAHGNADWASAADLKTMRTGIEIGMNPYTRLPVRIHVEGNLLTIAPPRTGKTTGFIIPNLAVPDGSAWSGPAVVIDPKGDAFRAVNRRRKELGRTVRCVDPLNFVGGIDRWNPLLRADPEDVLYLQSMALALLPESAVGGEQDGYFRSRATDLIVGALITCIRNGHPDAVAAAELLNDTEALRNALANHTDAASRAALFVLNMDDKNRGGIESTAQLATQWLRDQRMQQAVQTHTFEMSDLANGDVDLFIVIPADDRKKILAPYIRWLLADLFAAVRVKKPKQRILTIIDEAAVLGRFSAIIEGAGELPGYGVSLWTFWHSRHQMIETYGRDGAETLLAAAEMVNLFNLPAVQPDELDRWSQAIGTFTGITKTNSTDPQSGKTTTNRGAEAQRLLPADGLLALLRRQQVVFLSGSMYTHHPLRLGRTKAHADSRFAGLLDSQDPVGRSG